MAGCTRIVGTMVAMADVDKVRGKGDCGICDDDNEDGDRKDFDCGSVGNQVRNRSRLWTLQFGRENGNWQW
jgi:hypothetical protein